MSSFYLITYANEREYSEISFYILNKGLNSGKPMNKPCPNCFVCICDTLECKEKMFWMSYALWKAKQFEKLLKGSVIPFLTISDTRTIFRQNQLLVDQDKAEFKKSMDVIMKLEESRCRAEKQIVLIEQMKTIYLRNLFK